MNGCKTHLVMHYSFVEFFTGSSITV